MDPNREEALFALALERLAEKRPHFWTPYAKAIRHFLEFSPDSKILVSTYLTERGIHILEARTGRYLGQLAGHRNYTVQVAFSPDGRTLASTGGDGALKLWHLPTRREVATVLESGAVGPIAFSPDGSMLIAGTPDEVRIFRAPTLAETDAVSAAKR